MENIIYIFTRAVLIICILVIAYIIAIPEKSAVDDWDI